MSDARWERIKAVFEAALEVPAQDRPAVLDRECAGDAGLRREVESLLDARTQAFVRTAGAAHAIADAVGAPGTQQEQAGEQIGHYKLLQPIGEGGFGVVWMAEQREPVKRLVALKIIKLGMDTRQVIARFAAERQALAMMDHPNIARVFDAGATEAGRPYFVMEYIKGVSILEYCDTATLDTRARLELFGQVCNAIQHAHQKGIIHRDIKPSNVLVTMHDGVPVPKVIDFGIAKATSGELTTRTMFTEHRQMVGTPAYMSPEQAEMSGLDIDTRSDIYSLGVLLYELLTGTTPFESKSLLEAGLAEMMRIIREVEPPKPSTRLSSLGDTGTRASRQRPAGDTRRLGLSLRGDLDWIVMKCLEKDRTRRYETASGLAADIRRHLNNEPVTAGSPGASYRLRKFVSRNRSPVAAGAGVLAALIAGIIGTASGLIRAEHRRAEAERAESETLAAYRAATDDAIERLIGSKPELGPQEKYYVERTLQRWQRFAARQGDDERSMAIRAEGHHWVADLWYKLGRRDESLTEYEAARDLYALLIEKRPEEPRYQHDHARARNSLGILLAHRGRRDAARVEIEAARDVHQKLAAASPDVPEYRQELANDYHNLGNILLAFGERDAAAKAYENARDLRRALADAHPGVPGYQQRLATVHNNLGVVLGSLGRREAAREEYTIARDLLVKLAVDFPGVPEYQLDLATTYNSLGNVLRNLGQREAARPEFESARALQQRLADTFPAVPRYKQDLARTRNNLGHLLSDLELYDDALAEYRAALELREKLVGLSPSTPQYRQDLAATHSSLGALLYRMARYEAARFELDAAIELRSVLAAALPEVVEHQIDLGDTYLRLGCVLRDSGQVSEGLKRFDRAISTLTPVYERDHRVIIARQNLRDSYAGRAGVHDLLKNYAEAVKDWDRAIELDPAGEQPSYRERRAASVANSGKVDGLPDGSGPR